MAARGEPMKPEVTYRYEARMAMINAGILSLELGRQHGIYEVLGQFNVSSNEQVLQLERTFRGQRLQQDGNPQTKAYLTRSKSSDDGYKVVILHPRKPGGCAKPVKCLKREMAGRRSYYRALH